MIETTYSDGPCRNRTYNLLVAGRYPETANSGGTPSCGGVNGSHEAQIGPENPREGATKGKHSAPDKGAAIPSTSPSPVRLPGDATGEHEIAGPSCAICAGCGDSGEWLCPTCNGEGENVISGIRCFICEGRGVIPCPTCYAGSDAGERGA